MRKDKIVCLLTDQSSHLQYALAHFKVGDIVRSDLYRYQITRLDVHGLWAVYLGMPEGDEKLYAKSKS